MYDKGFIYSFWNDDALLYIGKTENQLLDRLRTHSHCDKKVYQATKQIKFMQCENPIVLDLMEKVLISQLKPLYNIRDRYSDEQVSELLDKYGFNFEINWEILPQSIFHFTNKKLTKEEIRAKQLEGIKKAKEEGKYKGRKPMIEARQKFVELIPLNISGERTALSICKEIGISPNSFYRWKLKWERGELFNDE